MAYDKDSPHTNHSQTQHSPKEILTNATNISSIQDHTSTITKKCRLRPQKSPYRLAKHTSMQINARLRLQMTRCARIITECRSHTAIHKQPVRHFSERSYLRDYEISKVTDSMPYIPAIRTHQIERPNSNSSFKRCYDIVMCCACIQ